MIERVGPRSAIGVVVELAEQNLQDVVAVATIDGIGDETTPQHIIAGTTKTACQRQSCPRAESLPSPPFSVSSPSRRRGVVAAAAGERVVGVVAGDVSLPLPPMAFSISEAGVVVVEKRVGDVAGREMSRQPR